MANRQIGWSQEANLLYYISGQVDRVAQIIASAVSGGGVSSFNTRTGGVTLLSADVTGALGFTPVSGNLYTTNGALTSDRTITFGAYKLYFAGGDIYVNGIRVGRGNTNGSQDVAVGNLALNVATTSGASTAIGYATLSAQTTGYRNTAVGAASGANITTGIQNVFFGGRSGAGVTTGSNNVHIGYAGGVIGLTTGSYNTIIGSNLSGLSATLSNNIIIADGQANQRIVVDNSGNTVIGSSAYPTFSGYKLDVLGTLRASQFYLSALNSTPASASATGTLGEIRIDANFIYVCVATNTWKRASIATW